MSCDSHHTESRILHLIIRLAGFDQKNNAPCTRIHLIQRQIITDCWCHMCEHHIKIRVCSSEHQDPHLPKILYKKILCLQSPALSTFRSPDHVWVNIHSEKPFPHILQALSYRKPPRTTLDIKWYHALYPVSPLLCAGYCGETDFPPGRGIGLSMLASSAL